MMKEFILVAGLPRSGSTLLCNILAQNPIIYAHGTSGLLDMLLLVRNHWHDNATHRGYIPGLSQEILPDTLRAMMQGYYAHSKEHLIIDKSRAWPAHLELYEQITGERPKVLVTIRDLRAILASIEKLYRRNMSLGRMAQEAKYYARFQTVAGRCEAWMREDEPLGVALNRIRDAFARGWGDCLHLISYEELTSNPALTMRGIYEFLDRRPFNHDFDNVRQVTFENDLVATGIHALHTIRPKVTSPVPDWDDILGSDVSHKYSIKIDNF